MRYLLCCLLPLLLLSACEIVPAPYFDPEALAQLPADEKCLIEAQQQAPFDPAAGSVVKKVLLEEMTGHKCGNCPRASEMAYDLTRVQHPGRIFLVSIHAGPLANFAPSASKYFTNFKTEEGDAYFTTLNQANAVPYGMIDRVEKGTNHNAWPGFVEARLAQPPIAALRIYNCFEPDSGSLGTVVDVKYFADAPATERLCVFLVEDGVVDWQTDYSAPNGSPDIPDYVHHDVFRGALNGTWGQPLRTTAGGDAQAIRAGDTFTHSYGYRIPENFEAANCKIVAFTYDFATQEVRQVEVMPIVF